MEKRGGSGRGQGRKSKDEEKRIRDLASPYTTNAIDTVIEIMQSKESKDADRISCAKLLLAYTFGTPVQTVDQTTNLNINDFDVTKLYNKEAQTDLE